MAKTCQNYLPPSNQQLPGRMHSSGGNRSSLWNTRWNARLVVPPAVANRRSRKNLLCAAFFYQESSGEAMEAMAKKDGLNEEIAMETMAELLSSKLTYK